MEFVSLQVYELEDTSNQAASIVDDRSKLLDDLSAKVETLQAEEHRISNEYAELQQQHEEADAKQQQRLAKLNAAKDAVKKAKREAESEQSKLVDAIKALSSQPFVAAMKKPRTGLAAALPILPAAASPPSSAGVS